MTDPRRLSERELEDIIGYEADFTGATHKPTTTFLMAHEIVALRAENARLREELEEIEIRARMAQGDRDDLHLDATVSVYMLCDIMRHIEQYARAALQEGSDD